MSGRAVAGAHSRSKDESDPLAGKFHFDYCFLKNEVKDDPAVTLVGVDKATDAILAHVVPEKKNQVRAGGDSVGARRPTDWISWETGG